MGYIKSDIKVYQNSYSKFSKNPLTMANGSTTMALLSGARATRSVEL